MRAQVAVEYLMITLLALSLLTLSLLSLGIIKQSAEKSFRLLSFRSYTEDLSIAINEVCAMGTGNSMQVRLSDFPITVAYADLGIKKIYRFTDNSINASIVKFANCPLKSSAIVKTGAVIKNKGNYIEIN